MANVYQVLADSVVMTGKAELHAQATTELLFGEQVETIGRDDEEWIECRSLRDGYEGFVPAGELDHELTAPTHFVSSLRTFAFAEPDYKSPPVRVLSFMSPVNIFMEENGYGLLMQGGWVPMQHLLPIDHIKSDIIEHARMFLGAPYLWGGRTSLGLDCSALVQLCLMCAGIECPRDTKDQAGSVGKAIKQTDIQAGDLVYFNGHVGIMVDNEQLINATARYMSVVIENLEDVVNAYKGITAIRRV